MFAGEDRVEQGRLRGARLHGDALADEIGRLADARLLQRDDREAVGLQDRRDDLHRRALGAQLHRGGRIGEADIGLSGRDELRGRAGAASFLDRQVDPGLLVETQRLRVHEARLRAAGEKVQRELQRLAGAWRVGRAGGERRRDGDRLLIIVATSHGFLLEPES